MPRIFARLETAGRKFWAHQTGVRVGTLGSLASGADRLLLALCWQVHLWHSPPLSPALTHTTTADVHPSGLLDLLATNVWATGESVLFFLHPRRSYSSSVGVPISLRFIPGAGRAKRHRRASPRCLLTLVCTGREGRGGRTHIRNGQ